MKIIQDQSMIIRHWIETEKAGSTECYADSEVFPGFVFWNATGSEQRRDFPTIYFPKEPFITALKNLKIIRCGKRQNEPPFI